ncbi:MAG: 1-acyl-sn-glycerol-3-phosphate acyltransferase [Bacteroidaceae bacterium]
MFQHISRIILFKFMGWEHEVTVPYREKCIICVAPHTSNLDFFIAKLYYAALGRHSDFLMKKEWFFWPLGILLRKIGGIPVFRSKKCSLTDQLAEIAKHQQRFQLAITPEGTRSLNAEWKKGFYYIAEKANIPILLYAVDYQKKRIVCTKELMASGNIEADMRTIKEYYKDFTGKHPEKFTVGNL